MSEPFKPQEKEIKELIINGFERSMQYAEAQNVSPNQFSEWARHAILSIFLGSQDLEDKVLPSKVRKANLEKNLGDFVAASRAFYDQYLIDEENQARPTRSLKMIEKN